MSKTKQTRIKGVLAQAKAVEAEAETASRLGIIERRKLGLTFANALRIARKLHAEGTLVDDDSETAAAQVAAAMVAENPQAFKAVAGERDWSAFFDQLIAFLEKLMPLILQLIQIFAV